MSAKSDHKQKRSLARKQNFHAFNYAVNHGLAVSIIWGSGMNFLHQIEKEEEKTLMAMRRADDYATSGYRSQLEYRDREAQNKPESDFGTGYRMYFSSGSCDVEMNETEKSLVYCASRHESHDRPMS